MLAVCAVVPVAAVVQVVSLDSVRIGTIAAPITTVDQ